MGKTTFSVTGDQLKQISSSAAQSLCDEVASAIKRYSDKFGIITRVFDYGCRLRNGAPSTKDGSVFKGHCFIHLTGRGTYEVISKEWNKDKENVTNQKDFTKLKADGGHFEELETDVDVAIKAALYYWNWKTHKANYYADNEDIDKLTFLVNGGDNGLKDRKNYTSKAKEILK